MARTASTASENFRRNFAGLLKARGVSLLGFCNATKLNRPALFAILKGDQGASLDRAEVVAKHFGLTVGDLCDGILDEVAEVERQAPQADEATAAK